MTDYKTLEVLEAIREELHLSRLEAKAQNDHLITIVALLRDLKTARKTKVAVIISDTNSLETTQRANF
jgi:hypothetical protein